MTFLEQAREIIEELSSDEIAQEEIDENYLEALNDLMYACDCSEIAFRQHLEFWLSKVVYCKDDGAYHDAIVDVAEALSKAIDEERMSCE